MIKNFDFAITDLDGKPVEVNGKAVIARDLILSALGANYNTERVTEDGVTKFRRYEIALKIVKGGDIDLTPEDIVMIKDMCGKGLSTFAVGHIYTYLNQ